MEATTIHEVNKIFRCLCHVSLLVYPVFFLSSREMFRRNKGICTNESPLLEKLSPKPTKHHIFKVDETKEIPNRLNFTCRGHSALS